MIHDLKPRLIPDQRGAITCGSRNAQGYPQKLDHWNITAFPELAAIYGNEPKELLVYVPGTLEEVFDCYKGAWGGKTAKRLCDGRECTHRITERVGGTQYGEGEVSACVCTGLPADSKERCVTRGRLYVMVAHPETGQIISPCIYVMRTGSYNNIVTIYSELWRIRSLAQAMPNHPDIHEMLFSVSIHMASSSGAAKKTFPVWRMQAVPSESYFQQLSAGKSPQIAAPAQRQLSQSVEEHDVEIVGDEDEFHDEPPPPSVPPKPKVATPPTKSSVPIAPIPEQPKMPTSEQTALFHRLGKELYGAENWKTQQLRTATWISEGRAADVAGMNADEVQTCCWIIQLKTSCEVYGVTEEEWKKILQTVELVDIAKMSERHFHRIGWHINFQVLRKRHGWTTEEWEHLIEQVGVIDMALLDGDTAKVLQGALATRRDEIRESMAVEAAERESV